MHPSKRQHTGAACHDAVPQKHATAVDQGSWEGGDESDTSLRLDTTDAIYDNVIDPSLTMKPQEQHNLPVFDTTQEMLAAGDGAPLLLHEVGDRSGDLARLLLSSPSIDRGDLRFLDDDVMLMNCLGGTYGETEFGSLCLDDIPLNPLDGDYYNTVAVPEETNRIVAPLKRVRSNARMSNPIYVHAHHWNHDDELPKSPFTQITLLPETKGDGEPTSIDLSDDSSHGNYRNSDESAEEPDQSMKQKQYKLACLAGFIRSMLHTASNSRRVASGYPYLSTRSINEYILPHTDPVDDLHQCFRVDT
jgi:hypothetical protein